MRDCHETANLYRVELSSQIREVKEDLKGKLWRAHVKEKANEFVFLIENFLYGGFIEHDIHEGMH